MWSRALAACALGGGVNNVLIELFSGQPDDALRRWEVRHVGMTIPITAEFVALVVTGLHGCYFQVARG